MIRSWGKISDTNTFTVIIDNMMNLELLVWSAAHGGTVSGGSSAELLKLATHHADRALELFFRPDGSTCHVVELDPLTGSVIRKRTAQGKADASTWSRGQTWAMYGYAYLYEATKERRYLEAALKASDLYLSRLPADSVPPADFDSDLKGLEFKDSSAAAIAASAFLRLHRLVETPELKKKYREAAAATLRSLTSEPYFSSATDKASLLVYAARNYHTDPSHPLTNTSLIWGDYYLLEALLQYRTLASENQHKE
jgi:unsaturated chondroitin disaccharide hydrolase